MRVKVTLACTECKQRNYNTMKNKKNDPDRLEMNKYCRFCRKHTLHKETKQRTRAAQPQRKGGFTMADEKIVPADKAAEDKAGKAEKDPKSAKKKGPGLGTRMAKYFRDTKGEFKKIVWPTFPTVLRNTGVVLALCVVLGVIICLVDFGLGALVDLMLSLG